LPVKIEAALFGYNHTIGGYKASGGHLRYLKTEVFEDEENRDKHTKSSGVYSFAIILFVVLNGKVQTNVLQSICDRVRLGFFRCGIMAS
jgi:hypothetical protein